MKLLWQRMQRATTAKAHAAVDRMEDPIHMLDQVVREKGQALNQARVGLKQASFWVRRINEQVDKEQKTIADMEQVAVAALKQNQKDAARQAVIRKQEAEQRLSDLNGQQERAQKTLERQQQQCNQMEQHLVQLRERRMLLRQRAMFVQSARACNSSEWTVDESAEAIFERMEERIGMAEAMVGDEPCDMGGDDTRMLDNFVKDQKVEAELLRLESIQIEH
ncbi:PspA/IM30 family protein [Acanthopleuribacter pedis]|uniref:PspA/IM30 family protein n=1 Tax=Acanthopleuribacter pedis TaxID=442870 RepID=A0A8J7QHP5_9BACT|nr:PspA/IM30 family protein [Acanthopleuribacter pedis]MBO1320726.1 PspA/IM30 family protein [Acanthopleuribacter pedis]